MAANAARQGALRRVVAGAWALGGIMLAALTSVAHASDAKAAYPEVAPLPVARRWRAPPGARQTQ